HQRQGALEIHPGGKWFCCGSGSGEVALFDPLSGRKRSVMPGHKGTNVALAFSPDGRLLASAGTGDRIVRVWDPATGRLLQEVAQEGRPVCLAFAPTGKPLLVVGCAGAASGEPPPRVVLLDPESGKVLGSWPTDHV